MYSRKENIEEEKIDWESHTVPSPVRKKKLISKLVSPFKSAEDKAFNYTGGKEKDLLNENLKLVFIFSLLFLPYIVGFIVSYFLFYVYGGMNIIDFIMRQHGSLYFQFWAIGIYLVIVIGIIWTLINSWSGSYKN